MKMFQRNRSAQPTRRIRLSRKRPDIAASRATVYVARDGRGRVIASR
jgi:hypothetical protein